MALRGPERALNIKPMAKPKKDNKTSEKLNMTLLEVIHEEYPGAQIEKIEKYHPIDGIQYYLVKIKDKIYYINVFQGNQKSYKEVLRRLRIKNAEE